MKRKLLLLAALLAAVVGAGLYAEDSSYYYVNVPVEKVYPYKLGLVVTYRTTGNEFRNAYIPNEWFLPPSAKVGITAEEKYAARDDYKDTNDPGATAELILLGNGSWWPHLTVYYHNGAFEFLRLYVRKDRNHETWGYLKSTTDLDAEFDADPANFALDFGYPGQ